MIAGGEKCLYLWYKANIYCIFKYCVSEREREVYPYFASAAD